MNTTPWRKDALIYMPKKVKTVKKNGEEAGDVYYINSEGGGSFEFFMLLKKPFYEFDPLTQYTPRTGSFDGHKVLTQVNLFYGEIGTTFGPYRGSIARFNPDMSSPATFTRHFQNLHPASWMYGTVPNFINARVLNFDHMYIINKYSLEIYHIAANTSSFPMLQIRGLEQNTVSLSGYSDIPSSATMSVYQCPIATLQDLDSRRTLITFLYDKCQQYGPDVANLNCTNFEVAQTDADTFAYIVDGVAQFYSGFQIVDVTL